MNIYSPHGTKVIFAYPTAGYDGDIKAAADAGLVAGETYTVVSTNVSSCITYIKLEEFPGKTFNSVQFKHKN